MRPDNNDVKKKKKMPAEAHVDPPVSNFAHADIWEKGKQEKVRRDRLDGVGQEDMELHHVLGITLTAGYLSHVGKKTKLQYILLRQKASSFRLLRNLHPRRIKTKKQRRHPNPGENR